jgi:hypothetical protein
LVGFAERVNLHPSTRLGRVGLCRIINESCSDFGRSRSEDSSHFDQLRPNRRQIDDGQHETNRRKQDDECRNQNYPHYFRHPCSNECRLRPGRNIAQRPNRHAEANQGKQNQDEEHVARSSLRYLLAEPWQVGIALRHVALDSNPTTQSARRFLVRGNRTFHDRCQSQVESGPAGVNWTVAIVPMSHNDCPVSSGRRLL